MARRRRKPTGEYAIGSNIKLPFFKREIEDDYSVWLVTWRWPWGDVTQKYKINLPKKKIKKTIKDLPTLWGIVKFLTASPNSEVIKSHPDGSFREWLEGVGVGSIQGLVQSHFGIRDMTEKIDQSKIQSFLSLPGLRDLVSNEQIQALRTTLDSMPKERKSSLNLNWLLHTLGG